MNATGQAAVWNVQGHPQASMPGARLWNIDGVVVPVGTMPVGVPVYAVNNNTAPVNNTSNTGTAASSSNSSNNNDIKSVTEV